jgi:hypothetical protein
VSVITLIDLFVFRLFDGVVDSSPWLEMSWHYLVGSRVGAVAP